MRNTNLLEVKPRCILLWHSAWLFSKLVNSHLKELLISPSRLTHSNSHHSWEDRVSWYSSEVLKLFFFFKIFHIILYIHVSPGPACQCSGVTRAADLSWELWAVSCPPGTWRMLRDHLGHTGLHPAHTDTLIQTHWHSNPDTPILLSRNTDTLI